MKDLAARSGQSDDFLLSRKDSQIESFLIVPQTDTGGQVEYTKASERKRFKELGKKTGRKIIKMPFRQLADTTKDCSPTV